MAVSPQRILAGVPPSRDYGQWQVPLFLTEEIPLEPHPEFHIGGTATGTCGRCTRCLDACPTDAFVGPFHLDPIRCISYWTIESQKPIPRHLRPTFGNRIFGCDICQEVCPWNRHLPIRDPLLERLRARADRIAPPLLEGFDPQTPYWIDQRAFSLRFRNSPLKRAKRHGMLRNVCIALGNWGNTTALPALELALRDPHVLPRGHAAWAMGRIAARATKHNERAPIVRSLQLAAASEENSWVLEEIALAVNE